MIDEPRNERLPWAVRRWMPAALGIGATLAFAFGFVAPSLRDSERFDERRAAFENVVRALRGSDTAAERLMSERDRCLAILDASQPRLAPGLDLISSRDPDGTVEIEAVGSFAELGEVLADVGRSAGYRVRETSIERMEGTDRLRLAMRLAPVQGLASAEPAAVDAEARP